METLTEEDNIYDVLGIGFGPSNLALAIALTETKDIQEYKLRYAFVEKEAQFGWHSSLLLPDSQLQVSPLKDLATLRDPTSSFTFINYLHQKGRLVAYVNRGVSIPSRHEWTAYLEWAASRLDHLVTYNHSVVLMEAETSDSADANIHLLKVIMRNNDTNEMAIRFARNIIVGVGGVPRIPESLQHLFQDNQEAFQSRIVHSSSFLPQLQALQSSFRQRSDITSSSITSRMASTLSFQTTSDTISKCLKFAVIGSGQSSAEMSLHLRQIFPEANIKLIFRSSALRPSDDSAFVNAAAFNPDRTDVFWKGNEEDRKAWIEEYKRTNYGVVRANVLDEICKILYEQELHTEISSLKRDSPLKSGNYELVPNTQVIGAKKTELDQITLYMKPTRGVAYKEDEVEASFDAIFLGTGFQRRPKVLKFLEPLSMYYPILDENCRQRKAELGFKDEVETNLNIDRYSKSSDKGALERLRHRVRGITRDYRLVSYLSDAFMLPSEINVSLDYRKSESISSSPVIGNEIEPTSRSSHDSDITLASTSHHDVAENNTFLPSIYFLGGNEATHGLADSLLSIVAHRSGELTESILQSYARQNTAISRRTTMRSPLINKVTPDFKPNEVNARLCEKCPLFDEKKTPISQRI